MLLKRRVVDRIVRLALEEDIGVRDVTTEAIFEDGKNCCAEIIARDTFVVAGIPVVKRVFSILDPEISFTKTQRDGNMVEAGEVILGIEGCIKALLSGERVALNFLQRLSGIATLTRSFVERVRRYPVRILDTRKTTPLLRVLERYAVQVGGGFSHRFGLYDGILVKDNHIKASKGVKEIFENLRQRGPVGLKIEIEVDSLEQLKVVLPYSPDVVLLDNMDIEEIHRAVEIGKGKVLFEASGGVTLENVEAVAMTGVDFISVGALTHSAKAVDVSMEII